MSYAGAIICLILMSRVTSLSGYPEKDLKVELKKNDQGNMREIYEER